MALNMKLLIMQFALAYCNFCLFQFKYSLTTLFRAPSV